MCKNAHPKSHQVAATKRPDKFFGASPPPCGVSDVMQNLLYLYLFIRVMCYNDDKHKEHLIPRKN